jgi:hypothetical protein
LFESILGVFDVSESIQLYDEKNIESDKTRDLEFIQRSRRKFFLISFL